MSDRADFLDWVRTKLHDAELALHNGDAGPRRELWSRSEPVSVLGAWRNAFGQQELEALFSDLARQFSNCTSYSFELQTYNIVGDMAYTAGLEHTSASVDGEPVLAASVCAGTLGVGCAIGALAIGGGLGTALGAGTGTAIDGGSTADIQDSIANGLGIGTIAGTVSGILGPLFS